jgi:phosphatidylglycerol:prolipoprotein diacylglycerol transferase
MRASMLRSNSDHSMSLSARLDQTFSTLAECTILCRCQHVILVTFGVLVSVGALVWMVVTGSCLLAHGFQEGHVAGFMIGAALSAVAAGRGLWWVTNLRVLRHQPLLGLRRVGFVSWGALTGTVAFTAGFALTLGLPVMALSDAVMRGMFAAYAIGRIGCLTYGCCYGRISPASGVWYRNPDSKVVRERGPCHAPRYPTQVYSAAFGTLLFVGLNAMPYYEVPAGWITVAGCLAYPIGRAWVEVFRERERYIGEMFTTGQGACLVMFVAGCALLLSLDLSSAAPRPLPLSPSVIRQSLSLAPAILLGGFIVFVVTSVHWKRIGSW